MAKGERETSFEREKREEREKVEERERGERARDFDAESRRLDDEFRGGLDTVLKETLKEGFTGVAEALVYGAAAAEVGACKELTETCVAVVGLQSDEERELDEGTRERLARLRIESASRDEG